MKVESLIPHELSASLDWLVVGSLPILSQKRRARSWIAWGCYAKDIEAVRAWARDQGAERIRVVLRSEYKPKGKGFLTIFPIRPNHPALKGK